MKVNNIRSHAESCLEQFRILLNIEESLQVIGKAEDLYRGNIRLDDQRARFEIWAGNIGVFAENHASLDHRLRESEDARRLMISFLGTLCTLLQRAKESSELIQSASSESSILGDPDPYERSTSSAISSSFQGTETESTDAILALTIPPFEQRLQGVEKSIDRLHRLSLQIRRPAITQQNAKAERFPITDDEGNQIDKEFAQFAMEIVSHQFPDCNEIIKRRLAEGIVLRRRRFLYRQRHQRKLSSKTVIMIAEPERTTKPTMSVTDATVTVKGMRVLAEDTTLKTTNGEQPKVTIPPSQTSASAMVKSPISLDKILDEGSRASETFTAVSARANPVMVPGPPTPQAGSKEFECPYCCILISINYVKASRWRHHVMEDLQPYSCVFPDCVEHNILYSDRKIWTAHMQNIHSIHWRCTSKSHESCSFNSEQEYDDHMRAAHAGAFSEAQLPILRRRSRVPSTATFQRCPLCGCVPSTEEIQNFPQARSVDGIPQDRQRAVSDWIMKHLADHLEGLAIKALPWQDVEEVKSESAKSKRTDDGTVRSQDDSLSMEKLHSSRHGETKLNVEDGATTPISWDDDKFDPDYNGSYESEWAAIWPHPDYYGHDRDPVLQTLLKKLYMDASPNTKHSNGPKLPAYLVPLERDTNFFARQHALNAIENALCPNPDNEALVNMTQPKPFAYPRYFAIHGPGGMGKTQVAAHFAATHRDKFDAVLWVNAENASKIEHHFKEIAIALRLVEKSSPDATDMVYTRDALKRWLVNPMKNLNEKETAKSEKASWLLIFDGVEDGEVLNHFWPYDGPGSILITSRNPYSWASSFEIRPFSVEEATEYLLHIIGKQVSMEEKSAAVAIAQRLGGLPLALAQMGGIIAHTNITFSEFLKSYKEQSGRKELLQWHFDVVRSQTSKYELNVASVWAFDSLTMGARLLDVLAMLDPDGIPERLFSSSPLDGQFGRLAEVKASYKTARNELLARSLVSANKSNKTLFVHRLVQDVCRTRMGAAKFRERFLLAVGLVSAKWPFEEFTWRHGIARWAECEELIPHVSRLRDMFREISQSVDTFEDYAFAKLLVDAAWYCHERGKFVDGNAFNNQAQSICESMKLRVLEHPEYSPNAQLTLSQLNYSLAEISHTRGCIAAETNDPLNALKYHREFNSSMAKELSGTHMHGDMRLALSWNETGCAYMLDRNWLEGEKSFIKSIAEMKRINGYRPNMITLPVANLGLSYWLQGKYSQAAQILLEGLRDRQAIYGEDDKVSFVTGRLLHAIGNVKCSLRHFGEGREYHHRALIHYKSTLGNRHHRTADLFVKVADHNLHMQQYDMALVLLEHALEAYSNSAHFMPERLRASFKRTKALRGLNRVEEANTERMKCFNIYTKLYQDMVEILGSKIGQQQTREVDLIDDDVDILVAFWSR